MYVVVAAGEPYEVVGVSLVLELVVLSDAEPE